MAIYMYSAADRSGSVSRGERDAENERALAILLKAEGLFLLEARPKGGGLGKGLKIDIGPLLGRFQRIKIIDLMFFSRNLSIMVSAGLSLTRALEVSADQTSNPRFKKIISDTDSLVVQGKAFADALRPHQKVFGELYVNMIEVGEATGKLAMVLKLLANQMKKDYDLRKRVKGAMMYPVIILIVLFLIGALMMIYVVPSLVQTIKELNVELPFTTKIIIFMSDFMVNYGLYVLLGFVLLGVAFWRVLKSPIGKAIFDRMILRVPIFGPLVQKFNVARFCRILSYLITAGVPIVKSLEVTASILGNTLYRNATREAAGEIQKGKEFHLILKEHSNIFQPMVIQMISVGEETGKIADMMLRLALFFEEDVNATTKNLSTIIEPLLMVVIGGAVGFFAVSMLQPIYSSLGSI